VEEVPRHSPDFQMSWQALQRPLRAYPIDLTGTTVDPQIPRPTLLQQQDRHDRATSRPCNFRLPDSPTKRGAVAGGCPVDLRSDRPLLSLAPRLPFQRTRTVAGPHCELD
jgi:hypothetical protein